MKNKILFLLTICICGCLSMVGQNDDAKVLRPLKSSVDDYIPLLNSAGYEAFTFDLSPLSDGQYYISFKIKVYKDGKEEMDDLLGGNFTLQNIRLLSDFPEESRKEIKAEDIADPERGIFTMSKKLTIGLTPVVNDSIRPFMLELENMGGLTGQLNMQPLYENNDSVNGKKFYWYNTRPFKIQEITNGKFIPLVLYGSWWYDKDFDIFRFCGEKEVDPDMSSDILKYIPNYYVFGIEVNPIKTL
ncbi:MAG: DUF5041 domain-containing protein [Muribaculaceae bacterium]|nr:DUF5041 domain-containing protein [Muribaculaceae bacterium]